MSGTLLQQSPIISKTRKIFDSYDSYDKIKPGFLNQVDVLTVRRHTRIQRGHIHSSVRKQYLTSKFNYMSNFRQRKQSSTFKLKAVKTFSPFYINNNVFNVFILLKLLLSFLSPSSATAPNIFIKNHS